MDLSKIIQDLTHQREKIERTIAELELLQQTDGGGIPVVEKRRGRKSMGPEERQEVSARMKKYWASRRGRDQKLE